MPTRHRWTTAPIHRSGRDGALCGIPRNGPTPARCALLLAAILSATCGGGSNNHQPTSPSPAPPVPVPSSACNAITGNLGLSLGIVNGALCSSADSSVVLIRMMDESGALTGSCSGTVIAARAVLTAAHCVHPNAATVDVWPGSGGWVAGASFVVYPSHLAFASTTNDVAVIVTRDDLRRSPIPILTSRRAELGDEAVIAGWGRDGNEISGVLRAGMATITRVGIGELQTQYESTGSGTCAGDSGGPLLLSEGGTWAVAGITAGSSQVHTCSAPTTTYYAMLANPDTQAFVLSVVPDALRR